MPSIVVAKDTGACFGVERALKMVEEALLSSDAPVASLGPLIHNPKVVAELSASGVELVDSPEEAAGKTLVFRTHGVTPEEEEQARDLCVSVVDCICPFVKRAHQAVESFEAESRRILIVGEKGHPEVIATAAHAHNPILVTLPGELREIELPERLGIVVQTTQSEATLDAILEELGRYELDIKLENTICAATHGHQDATRELANQADVMIIIGGKNSANTRHLADIASEICKNTHHIEDKAELLPTWFDGAETIGIAAGASTPASQINEVKEAISELVSKA